MSSPLLPVSLISNIVDLVNISYNTDAVVIQINSNNGCQMVEPNPLRLEKLTTSVKDAVYLVKKQLTSQRVINEINNILYDTGFIDFETPELVLKREIRRLVFEYATEIDEMIQQTIYCWWDDTYCNPIAQAFYKKMYEIVEQISEFSRETRIRYFLKIAKNLHCEEPELDIPMYDFITGYTQHEVLRQYVSQHVCIEQLELRNGPINDFTSLLIECSHDKCVSNLDLFEWADRNKENRYKWFTVVNGSYKDKRKPHQQVLQDSIRKLYPTTLKHDLFELLFQMEKKELDRYLK